MRRHGSFLLVLALVTAVLQSPILLGQAPPQTPGVTFQVEVNYVDVDVVVTDEQGNFVTGLAREDFEVFENGRPQKIDTFSLVEIPVEKPTALVIDDRPVAPDTQSNRKPFDGRVYVIVLDDLDVSAMRSTPLKDAARKFVREFMGANDLAAVVYTSGRKDAAQEFTTNRELVIASIDKFIGQRMRSLSLDRLDSYYQTIAFGFTSRNEADPNTGSINSQDRRRPRAGIRPDGARARDPCAERARHAEEHGGVSWQRPRPAQSLAVLQRGARLSDSRRVRCPRCDDRDPGDAGRNLHCRARQCELLRDRSARPGGYDHRLPGRGRDRAMAPAVPVP